MKNILGAVMAITIMSTNNSQALDLSSIFKNLATGGCGTYQSIANLYITKGMRKEIEARQGNNDIEIWVAEDGTWHMLTLSNSGDNVCPTLSGTDWSIF